MWPRGTRSRSARTATPNSKPAGVSPTRSHRPPASPTAEPSSASSAPCVRTERRRPFRIPSATGVAEEQPVGDQQDQGATDGGAPGGGVEELVVDGAVEELGGEP